jgi:predicted aldo/keto reductase-like oxidoreductase
MLTQRRRLGRTGLEIGVVGIGAGDLDGTGALHRAVAKGLNYLDTSCCYGNGSSETLIGRAIVETPSLRDQIVLATKWDASARMPKATILASLDDSLKRMHTDHVEIMQIHALGTKYTGDDGFSRLDNPELYEAMDEAKRSGKVRFFGATSHAGNRSAILSHAIDKGFDMLLVRTNVLDYETAGIPKLLAHAKEKDVGVVVMKSQPQGGMMPPGFEDSKWNIYQANLRWCLSKDIACVIHSGIGTDEKVQDAAIGAVHDEVTWNDATDDPALLRRYADALSPHYCRACVDAACVEACPETIAIPGVLHAYMYEKHYGWPEQARETYGALGEGERWSERCASCDACTDACPYGVDAAGRVRSVRAAMG